jgi:hypothetical protein
LKASKRTAHPRTVPLSRPAPRSAAGTAENGRARGEPCDPTHLRSRPRGRPAPAPRPSSRPSSGPWRPSSPRRGAGSGPASRPGRSRATSRRRGRREACRPRVRTRPRPGAGGSIARRGAHGARRAPPCERAGDDDEEGRDQEQELADAGEKEDECRRYRGCGPETGSRPHSAEEDEGRGEQDAAARPVPTPRRADLTAPNAFCRAPNTS